MSVMTRFQNRRSRILCKDQKGKEHILIKKSRQEVLELFDNLVIKAGDTATLQDYIEEDPDYHDHGWIDQETKVYKPVRYDN
jgi:hypothetical protein